MNDTWAWDFRMPSGVPIVAASDGTVRLARGDSATGGCDPSFAAASNYVVIAHPNGYESQYLHMQTVVVAVGDQVKEGDLLGYSGKTGWACGSHLHFKVARPEGTAWNNPSVPARIKGYGDPLADSWVAAPQCDAARLAALEPKRSVDRPKGVGNVEPAVAQPGTGQTKAAVAQSQTGSATSPETTVVRDGPGPSGAGGTRRAPRAMLSGTGATE